MDYALPRADALPSFRTEDRRGAVADQSARHQGGGEGGTTGALATIISAIIDALSDFGVRDIKMPATPYNVWQAIEGASKDDPATRKPATSTRLKPDLSAEPPTGIGRLLGVP